MCKFAKFFDRDAGDLRFKKYEHPLHIKKDGKLMDLDMFPDFTIKGKFGEAGKEEIYESLSAQHIYPREILREFDK